MQLGFIGLGRMGRRMVTKLVKEGHEIVAWNRSSEKTEELAPSMIISPLSLFLAISDKVSSVTSPGGNIDQ